MKKKKIFCKVARLSALLFCILTILFSISINCFAEEYKNYFTFSKNMEINHSSGDTHIYTDNVGRLHLSGDLTKRRIFVFEEKITLSPGTYYLGYEILYTNSSIFQMDGFFRVEFARSEMVYWENTASTFKRVNITEDTQFSFKLELFGCENVSDIVFDLYAVPVEMYIPNDNTLNYSGDTMQEIYNQGVSAGQTDAYTTTKSMRTLIMSIFDAPMQVISNIFNFEVFGVNISSIIFFLISLLIVFFIFKVVKYIF